MKSDPYRIAVALALIAAAKLHSGGTPALEAAVQQNLKVDGDPDPIVAAVVAYKEYKSSADVEKVQQALDAAVTYEKKQNWQPSTPLA